MSSESCASQPEDPNEILSALVDGEADVAAQACARWRDDATLRERWHAYHLIGDVLRSDDLAHAPQRDAVFVAALRQRLAREPVRPLSPLPAPAQAAEPAAAALAAGPARQRRSLGWRAPAAMAAGFVLVAGMVLLMRQAPDAASGVDAPQMAAAPAAAGVMPATELVAAPEALVRDPQLDALLRAHQWARGGAIGSPPGVMLRNVDMALPVPPAAPMPAAARAVPAAADAGR